MVGDISKRNLVLKAGKPDKLCSRPHMTTTGVWKRLSGCDRRSLPAYIPAASVSEAIIGLVAPDTSKDATAGTQPTPTAETQGTPPAETQGMTMKDIQAGIDKLPGSMSSFKDSLKALATSAGQDIDQFRTSVEKWYDDHMSRVSGWYKQHVAVITFIVGAILVVLFNINTVTIGRTLYSDSVVRTAVSSVAVKGKSCPGNNQQKCLTSLQSQLSAVAQAGLPIGWGTVAACAAPRARCNWLEQRGIVSPNGSAWQVVLVILGFLLTIIALTPGARFWFDLLGKLGSLRSTGPKPTT
jgi:hypothetical protein